MTHADDPTTPEKDAATKDDTAADDTKDDTKDDTAADTAADAAAEDAATQDGTVAPPSRRRIDRGRIVAYGVLPTIAFVLAASAGVLKYVDTATRDDERAGVQAMAAATATTVAMLSYSPDDVDRQLNAASNLLTGSFHGQYLATIHNVVIPGAQQQQISAVTKVPAAAVVSAAGHRAVVMLYLDQTVTVGSDAPSQTLSSARATLEDVDGHWLISEFGLT